MKGLPYFRTSTFSSTHTERPSVFLSGPPAQTPPRVRSSLQKQEDFYWSSTLGFRCLQEGAGRSGKERNPRWLLRQAFKSKDPKQVGSRGIPANGYANTPSTLISSFSYLAWLLFVVGHFLEYWVLKNGLGGPRGQFLMNPVQPGISQYFSMALQYNHVTI